MRFLIATDKASRRHWNMSCTHRMLLPKPSNNKYRIDSVSQQRALNAIAFNLIIIEHNTKYSPSKTLTAINTTWPNAINNKIWNLSQQNISIKKHLNLFPITNSCIQTRLWPICVSSNQSAIYVVRKLNIIRRQKKETEQWLDVHSIH